MRAGALSMGRQEWGLLFALSIIRGRSFFLRGVALKALPKLTIVTPHVPLSAVILGFSILGVQPEVKRFFGMRLIGLGRLRSALQSGLALRQTRVERDQQKRQDSVIGHERS